MLPALILTTLMMAAPPARAPRTTPGAFYVEPGTLHSLGFQWTIEGDTNRDGRVTVHYRRDGEDAWREGPDLLRIHHEQVAPLSTKYAYTCGNLYAGSILFLAPAQTYHVRLTLRDPDNGADPVAVEEQTIATKTPPRPYEQGAYLHVYPPSFAGPRAQPAFADLSAAYKAAQPGDHVLLHAGHYAGNYKLDRIATRDRPLVIRAAGDGEVIITGGGTLFDVSDAQHVWIEDLTIKDYGIAIQAQAPVIGLTIRRCRFIDHNDCGIGIRSTASRDILVSDCEFSGSTGSWRDREKQKPYKAVAVAGQGVDICYNRVVNHWDGLSTWRCSPSEDFATKLCAIDFYNNDVSQIVDDNEADYGQHNIRFFHNRIVNAFIGLSAQPVFGGPCYFVRNVMYNVSRGVPFKLNQSPAGVLIYHNTAVSSSDEYIAYFADAWTNVHVFNNVFLGRGARTLHGGPVRGGFARFDYNAYATTNSQLTVVWTDPYFQDGIIQHVYTPMNISLAQLAQRFDIERHGMLIEYDAVVDVRPADAAQTYPVDFGDPRPRPQSPLIDRAVRLPGFNDDFTGAGPDIGAFELGQPLPHYGPRGESP